jgi:hypothetical protein
MVLIVVELVEHDELGSTTEHCCTCNRNRSSIGCDRNNDDRIIIMVLRRMPYRIINKIIY